MRCKFIRNKRLYKNEKLFMLKLCIYSDVLFLVSFILYFYIYGYVFDFIAICIIFQFSIWLVMGIKKIIKINMIIDVLHIMLIILAIVIPIMFFLDIPHYTLNKAINIVEKDATNKKGAKIQTVTWYPKNSTYKNFLVRQDYQIILECDRVSYYYLFDPISGQYSETMYTN